MLDLTWAKRCDELTRATDRLASIGAQDALTLLMVSFISPKVLHLLRCSPSADNPAVQTFDSHLRSVISKITNSALSDIQWLQASMPITHGGLGCEQSLKRAWRHGRAWKMKIRAWKNQDPCFNFYKHIYALLHKYPVYGDRE